MFTVFQPVTFGPEWTELKQVVFDGRSSTEQPNFEFYAIDNIVLNAPVVVDPDDAIDVSEPSSLAICGYGAIAFGWAVRRRACSQG